MQTEPEQPEVDALRHAYTKYNIPVEYRDRLTELCLRLGMNKHKLMTEIIREILTEFEPLKPEYIQNEDFLI